MNRQAFKEKFGTTKAVVLPVIHVIDEEQTRRNIKLALDGGCKGVFLINHDFGVKQFLPIIEDARATFPSAWIGINFLSITGKDAFPVLGELERGGTRIDGYWGDDARIDEARSIDDQPEASAILQAKKEAGWDGFYLGGTAFKKQRDVKPEDYATSATIACDYMDAVCTSGVATGKAADLSKIDVFRKACGDKTLAIASGVTPENVHHYAEAIDCIMVATGINVEGDFYNIDPVRLARLFANLEDGENKA
ncbi:MAG: BtpA/SgcQ family protein [Hyphomicrobiales bacterium]